MLKHPIIQGYIDGNAFGELLGMDFEILSDGVVAYRLTIKPEHLATPATAHGGILAAFADAILGVGALSYSCNANNVVATIEFKISFLHPARVGDQLTGTSKLLKAGKSIIFMEAMITNQNGINIASANGTFNQYPIQKLMDTL